MTKRGRIAFSGDQWQQHDQRERTNLQDKYTYVRLQMFFVYYLQEYLCQDCSPPRADSDMSGIKPAIPNVSLFLFRGILQYSKEPDRTFNALNAQ